MSICPVGKSACLCDELYLQSGNATSATIALSEPFRRRKRINCGGLSMGAAKLQLLCFFLRETKRTKTNDLERRRDSG
jgi:hypothetical protein